MLRMRRQTIWDAALDTAWDSAAVWVHGDVAHCNLLVREGRLAAVIDFGCMAVGDPACDLSIAWTLFRGEVHNAFRNGVAADDAIWARAQGCRGALGNRSAFVSGLFVIYEER